MTANERSAGIRLRRDRRPVWLLLVMLAAVEIGLSRLPVPVHPGSDRPGVWFPMAAFGLVFAVAIGLLATEFGDQVTVDDGGVVWRLGRKRGRAGWAEVTQYNDRIGLGSDGKTRQRMVLRAGTIEVEIPSDLLGDREAFRAYVALRAVRPGAGGWSDSPELPLAAGPLVFTYGTPTYQRRRAAAVFAAGGGFSLYWLCMILSRWAHIRHDLEFMGWLGWVLFAGIFGTMTVMWSVIAGMWWSVWGKFAWQRPGERFVLDECGITWERGDVGPVAMRWGDVADYYIDETPQTGPQPPKRCVVVDHDGRRMEFVAVMPGRDASRLRTLIRLYATNAATLGPPSTWVSRIAPTAAPGGAAPPYRRRTFPYGSRLTALLLTVPLGYGLMIASVVARSGAGWLAFAGFGAVAAPIVAAWAVCRVEIMDTCLEFRSLRGRRRTRWADVADYHDAGKSIRRSEVVTRSAARLTIWPWIAGYDELRAEIASRAPKPTTGWTASKKCNHDLASPAPTPEPGDGGD